MEEFAPVPTGCIITGAAREKVRVARSLETLPKISAAFARGAISYSKVRAMTRVATTYKENFLLVIAENGTASHTEQLVRKYQRVTRLDNQQVSNNEESQEEL